MNLSEYKKLLAEFVSYKSISTDPAYRDGIKQTHEWLEKLLQGYGFKTELLPTKETNPVVFGEYDAGADQTVLVYGHYDVQPAEADKWTVDPWILDERDGRLFARGAIDNKGQVLVHIYTIGRLIQEGKLKFNVKFMIEGNEETGNHELGQVIRDNKAKLAADYVILSDGEISGGRPTLDASLRGLVNLTIHYKTAKTNLHSGIYGGAVPSAPMELMRLISGLYDEDNRVAIPGFYDAVDEITDVEVANNETIPFAEKELAELTEIRSFKKEAEYDFFTQTGLRPMLTVSGFKAGYIEKGYASIIPAEAEAKLNLRLVESQDPREIFELVKKYIEDSTPDYVDVKVTLGDALKPIKLDTSDAKIQEVLKLMKKAYGEEPFLKYVGGSIGAVVDFKEVLGVNPISVAMANEDCNMHGADENFRVDLIEKGLKFSEMFFSK